ncbi:hypothetical protein JXQ31_21050 [candidate division KSB1 bacterium]|nr:hypothetical protein [candidate division KSB1 bacterium]
MCGLNWNTRQELLSDPFVEITGYLVNFKDPEQGIFTFNHMSCKGTFAVKVSFFTDLYKGEFFEQNIAGDEKCPNYCLNKFELDSCPEKCECAYVRDVIQLIKNFPK